MYVVKGCVKSAPSPHKKVEIYTNTFIVVHSLVTACSGFTFSSRKSVPLSFCFMLIKLAL